MVNAKIAAEVQSLAPSARIELFTVDLTSLGDTVYRFHAGTNSLYQPVKFQGLTYDPWPCEASGFDLTTNGQLPRPKLTLANVTGALSALAIAFSDCVGAKVTRMVTLAKFLDASNFPDGYNPSADPNAYFPVDVYTIDRKSLETKEVVEFELTAACDVVGVKLPKRQIIQNLCGWQYRGAECGYTGGPVADHNDQYLTSKDTSSAQEDTLINLGQDLREAKKDMDDKRRILNTASNKLIQAEDKSLIEERFFYSPPLFGSIPLNYCVACEIGGERVRFAFWNAQRVTLDETYRRGTLQPRPEGVDYDMYAIQYWAFNEAAYNAAEADYNAKKSAYDTAVTVYNGLKSAYEAATTSLPSGSVLFKQDICGKRLSSCQIRFKDDQLPFGGFPGVGLMA